MRHTYRKLTYVIGTFVIIALALVGYVVTHPDSGRPIISQQWPAPDTSSAAAQSGPSSSSTPTSAATEEWDTYLNRIYHYRIALAPSARVDNVDPKAVHFIFSQPLTTEGNPGVSEYSFSILVHENARDLTVADWVRAQSSDPDFVRRSEPVMIAGDAGYRQDLFEIDETSVHFYVGKGAYIFELTFPDPQSLGKELSFDQKAYYTNVFERLVSSFSFE
jgi:hypothetical protein